MFGNFIGIAGLKPMIKLLAYKRGRRSEDEFNIYFLNRFET